MFNTKTKTLFFLFFLSTSSWASDPISLKQVVNNVLNDNPQILAAQASETEKKDNVGVARGHFLPTVSVGLVRGQQYSANPVLDAEGIPSIDLTRKENSITLSQPLFAGGGILNGYRQAQAASDLAGFQLMDRQESIAEATTEVYLNVLRSRELLALARENVQAHEDMLNKVKVRYNAGVDRSSELHLAESRLALAKSKLTQSIGDEESNERDYQFVVGTMPPRCMTDPKTPWQQLPKTQDQAIALAKSSVPILHVAQENVRASDSAVDVTKAAFYPNVNLQLTASDDYNLDGIEGENKNRMAVVRVDYALFNGGSDRYSYDAAQAQRARAQALLSQTDRQVAQQVLKARVALLTDQKKEAILSGYYQTSQQVVQDYVQQFSIGKRPLFNVLDAQDEEFFAHTALINAQYDKRIDVYRELAALGSLRSYFSG